MHVKYWCRVIALVLGAVLYARGSHTWDTMSRRWHLPRRDGSTPSLVEVNVNVPEPELNVTPGANDAAALTAATKLA